MRKFVCILFLLSATISSAQELRMERNKFYDSNKRIKLSEYIDLMKSNQKAYILASKAKSGYSAGNFFGFVGGFLIGWPIGTQLVGGEPNWAFAWAGLGVLFVSIPFQTSANKKLRNATKIYNGVNVNKSASFNLGVSGSRIGITYSF